MFFLLFFSCFFAKFGDIIECRVLNGRGKGKAFVQFAWKAQADKGMYFG